MSRKGCQNVVSSEMRQSFYDVFARNGGTQGLYDWSNESKDNKRTFYLMCIKILPKEIKTEDLNRTHEQFIELMKLEKEHKQLTAGKPLELVEASSEKGRE